MRNGAAALSADLIMIRKRQCSSQRLPRSLARRLAVSPLLGSAGCIRSQVSSARPVSAISKSGAHLARSRAHLRRTLSSSRGSSSSSHSRSAASAASAAPATSSAASATSSAATDPASAAAAASVAAASIAGSTVVAVAVAVGPRPAAGPGPRAFFAARASCFAASRASLAACTRACLKVRRRACEDRHPRCKAKKREVRVEKDKEARHGPRLRCIDAAWTGAWARNTERTRRTAARVLSDAGDCRHMRRRRRLGKGQRPWRRRENCAFRCSLTRVCLPKR
eukprot:4089721-Pleurochrysis_carterae.AAC.3